MSSISSSLPWRRPCSLIFPAVHQPQQVGPPPTGSGPQAAAAAAAAGAGRSRWRAALGGRADSSATPWGPFQRRPNVAFYSGLKLSSPAAGAVRRAGTTGGARVAGTAGLILRGGPRCHGVVARGAECETATAPRQPRAAGRAGACGPVIVPVKRQGAVISWPPCPWRASRARTSPTTIAPLPPTTISTRASREATILAQSRELLALAGPAAAGSCWGLGLQAISWCRCHWCASGGHCAGRDCRSPLVGPASKCAE